MAMGKEMWMNGLWAGTPATTPTKKLGKIMRGGWVVTNREKFLLINLAKDGRDIKQIKEYVDCADSTIRRYIKIFRPLKKPTISYYYRS